MPLEKIAIDTVTGYLFAGRRYEAVFRIGSATARVASIPLLQYLKGGDHVLPGIGKIVHLNDYDYQGELLTLDFGVITNPIPVLAIAQAIGALVFAGIVVITLVEINELVDKAGWSFPFLVFGLVIFLLVRLWRTVSSG